MNPTANIPSAAVMPNADTTMAYALPDEARQALALQDTLKTILIESLKADGAPQSVIDSVEEGDTVPVEAWWEQQRNQEDLQNDVLEDLMQPRERDLKP